MLSPSLHLSHHQLFRRAKALKQELVSLLMGADSDSGKGPGGNPFFHRGNARLKRRLREANLVGIGFGVKETAKTFTGDLAIRCYVTRKPPIRDVPRRYRIPKTVNGIPTDVIKVVPPRLHSRPAPLGASISNVGGGAGSLGCVVSTANDEAWYILSACHVLAPAGGAASPKEIVEPAASHGGSVAIAMLTDFEPLRTDGFPNPFDAAIAQVLRKSDVRLAIPLIGPLQPAPAGAALYQSVRKYGAATLHTLGIITDTAADVRLTLDGEEYLFDSVLQVTGCGGQFSDGGDSGALVVDALTGRALGLIIGGGSIHSYVSPLQRVLTRFGSHIAA